MATRSRAHLADHVGDHINQEALKQRHVARQLRAHIARVQRVHRHVLHALRAQSARCVQGVRVANDRCASVRRTTWTTSPINQTVLLFQFPSPRVPMPVARGGAESRST